MTLRLLIDLARKKKEKLFVVFVDFSQAYDLVPRRKLFEVLKRLGCGAVMLAALVAIYRVNCRSSPGKFNVLSSFYFVHE